MRAAAILGLGCSPRDLKPFQRDASIDWQLGMPAAADQVDAILLFGGDGTVHRHVGQLVQLQRPVLVVPAGSGNDFATALRLKSPRDSQSAWERFCAAPETVRSIDLGLITSTGATATERPNSRPSVTSRYFCCVAGVGLDAEVARLANQMPRWLRGHGGYALSLLPAIFRFAPISAKIATPSAENKSEWVVCSERPTILAAFANTPFYGGGMKIAPGAKMDDGLLDICVLGGVNAFKLFCMFPTVYFGRHLGIREVKYFEAARVRVETEYPVDVYADGEYVCQTPVEVAVQSMALRVIV